MMSAEPQLDAWRVMAAVVDEVDGPASTCKEVNIALVGKYTGLQVGTGLGRGESNASLSWIIDMTAA